MLKKLVEDTKFEPYMRQFYECLEEMFTKFSNKLKSKKPPKKEELNAFMQIFKIEGCDWKM